MGQGSSTQLWRVNLDHPVEVFDEDGVHVGTFRTVMDAQRAVDAVNHRQRAANSPPFDPERYGRTSPGVRHWPEGKNEK